MEASVIRQAIEVERAVGTRQLQTQVAAEAATPGAGREAIDVLMEEAELSVDTIQAQTDRIVVDGTVYCQAVYRQGDAMAARAVTAQARVSEVIELPGVTPRSIVRVQGVVEQVEAGYENGRMRFECAIDLRAQALELETVDVISQIGGVDDLQVRFSQVCSSKLAAESAADALVREEVALPSALDARVSLMDWSQARLTSVQPDLGGVRAQGEVQAEALIGTGVTARPVALVKVLMPFEQLVELPEWLTGSVTAEATVKRLTTSVVPGEDESGAQLVLEAEVNIAVRADAQDCATALSDAYATGAMRVTCPCAAITMATGTEIIQCQEPVRGTLLLPDGAPGVGTVLATRVRPVVSQWMAQDGATVLEGALDVKALYLPGGSEQMRSIRGEIPFSVTCQGEWPEDAWIKVCAVGAEAAALMSDRLEVRLTLLINGFYRKTEKVELAESAEVGEAPERRTGLVIHWPEQGDSAWSVGKRYSLPLDRVVSVNGGQEALKEGQPIVVMV